MSKIAAYQNIGGGRDPRAIDGDSPVEEGLNIVF